MTAPRTADSKAARTRARILRVAASEIARRGYGGASLRSIASESGLQLGSIYFHFASKDELVAEVLREGIDAAIERVSEAVRGLPDDVGAGTLLRTAMRAHLEALHASHDRAAAVVWMTETMPESVRREQYSHARRYSRWWLSLLCDLGARGELRTDIAPDILRDIVFGALNATLSRNQRSHTDIVEALATLVLSN